MGTRCAPQGRDRQGRCEVCNELSNNRTQFYRNRSLSSGLRGGHDEKKFSLEAVSRGLCPSQPKDDPVSSAPSPCILCCAVRAVWDGKA